MTLTYTPFMNKMAALFKADPTKVTIFTMGSFYDTASIDKHLGRPLPKDLTDQDYANMKHLFDWKLLFQRDFDLMRAMNSEKFMKVIGTFDARIKGVRSYPVKWVFLSAHDTCLLYTSPSPRDKRQSRMPSSA